MGYWKIKWKLLYHYFWETQIELRGRSRKIACGPDTGRKANCRYWGYIGNNGKENGNYRDYRDYVGYILGILGLCRDNGKENGNHREY